MKNNNKSTVTIFSDNLTISRKAGDVNVSNTTGIIFIDDADIFTIRGLNLYRITDNEEIREERLDYENFRLPWNKTWGLSIDLFRALFPYEHSFAQAVQNDFIALFKWLKILHGSTSIPFAQNSPLPSDLLIKVICCMTIILVTVVRF